jgi:DNA end-binding protein Ku
MSVPVWKGELCFASYSLPIKITAGAREETDGFNQIHRGCGSRVKQLLMCADQNNPVERADLVKGFEYSKGSYVTFEDKEIDELADPSKSTIAIHGFVPLSEIPLRLVLASYFVEPADRDAEPVYAALLNAMRSTGRAGFGKVVLSSRQRTMVFSPGQTGMVASTLFFRSEAKQLQEFRTGPVPPKLSRELTLVVEKLSARFDPDKLIDGRRERINALIQSKVDAATKGKSRKAA